MLRVETEEVKNGSGLAGVNLGSNTTYEMIFVGSVFSKAYIANKILWSLKIKI